MTAVPSVLNVPVSQDERDVLEFAAGQTGADLGDYVRRRAVEAAEIDVLEYRLATIPAQDWEKFEVWVNTPPKDVHALRKLAASHPAWLLQSHLNPHHTDGCKELVPPRPLAATDNRYAFDCGRNSLNQWFWRHAWDNQEARVSRTSVVCDAATGDVVGYVALTAAQIERAYLPESTPRDRPDPVPAMMLSPMAVDRRHHGKGCGRALVRFAMVTAIKFAENIGCFGVLTHPLDDNVRAFYAHLGFEMLPFDPKRSMIVRVADLQPSGF